MIYNKFGQLVYTIEELNDMGVPEEVEFDEESVLKKIRPRETR